MVRLLLAALLATSMLALVAPTGCGPQRDRDARRSPAPASSGDAEVSLLEGRTGDLVVWATPLGLGEAPTQWYRERLTALVPASAERSFVRLFVFHVGQDGARSLVFDAPSLDVETEDRRYSDVPLLDGATTPATRASVLTSKALRSFDGVALAPGSMLEALVAFDGRFGVPDLLRGRLRAGEAEVALVQTTLPWTELQRLLESPGREALVARVADRVGEVAPTGPLSGVGSPDPLGPEER